MPCDPDMDRVFPCLKAVNTEYQWGGLLGIGANRLPQIGRLRDQVYYTQAYAGLGLAASHLAGRIIADTITGDDAILTVFNRIKHIKFPGGRRYWPTIAFSTCSRDVLESAMV